MNTVTSERSGRIALRVSSAAEVSDVSRTMLYGAMQAGELPYVQIGKSRRILVADLEQWLRRHRVAADEPDAA